MANPTAPLLPLETEKLLDQLEQLLSQQITLHENLLQQLGKKHQALREGDRDRIVACCERENDWVQKIGDAEKNRQALIGRLTQALSPMADTPLSLLVLADRVAEPRRGRLLVLRQQLRGLIQDASQKAAVAKRASDALVGHMQGVIQTITGVMTGTYTGRGRVPQPAMAVSTFNATG